MNTMRIKRKYRVLFLGCLLVCLCQVNVKAQFVHPGILSTKAELDYVKRNQNREPWKSALTALKQSDSGSPDYSLQGPFTAIYRETGNTTGWVQHGKDATACYVQALLGYLTGDTTYTQNAIGIINAWSGTLRTIGGKDAALLAGIQAPLWAMAGDILAHTDTGWAEGDRARTKGMLKEVFMPVIDDFAYESGANWGTSCMFAMMAIAVFTDDAGLFEKAWNAYTSTDGCPNDYSLYKNIAANGQNVESGRDQVHSWSSYEMLAGVAAIAYNQGKDPYTLGDNRLKTGVEYWCKYNLGETVPYDRSVYRCRKGWGPWEVISETGRGIPVKQGSVCNMVYRAYQRLGVDAPYTKKMADVIGNTITEATAPNGWGAPFIADALLYNMGSVVPENKMD